jgi:hypothetical protein
MSSNRTAQFDFKLAFYLLSIVMIFAIPAMSEVLYPKRYFLLVYSTWAITTILLASLMIWKDLKKKSVGNKARRNDERER